MPRPSATAPLRGGWPWLATRNQVAVTSFQEGMLASRPVPAHEGYQHRAGFFGITTIKWFALKAWPKGGVQPRPSPPPARSADRRAVRRGSDHHRSPLPSRVSACRRVKWVWPDSGFGNRPVSRRVLLPQLRRRATRAENGICEACSGAGHQSRRTSDRRRPDRLG